MKSVLKKEDGFFTLLEGVVVLSITMLLLILPTMHSKPVENTLATDVFINQLKSDITLMHQSAIINGEMSVIEIEPSRKQIVYSVAGNQSSHLNKTVKLPADISIYGGYQRFSFRPFSGHLTNVNRVRFKSDQRVFDLVFQIGSGRFYVKDV